MLDTELKHDLSTVIVVVVFVDDVSFLCQRVSNPHVSRLKLGSVIGKQSAANAQEILRFILVLFHVPNERDVPRLAERLGQCEVSTQIVVFSFNSNVDIMYNNWVTFHDGALRRFHRQDGEPDLLVFRDVLVALLAV